MKQSNKVSQYPNETKDIKHSLYEEWEAQGQPCCYVKFQAPVPKGVNLEPVYEFRVGDAHETKYTVDQITDTVHGIIFRYKGHIDRVFPANCAYARSIQLEQS